MNRLIFLLITVTSCAWMDEQIHGKPEVTVNNLSASTIGTIYTKGCGTADNTEADWNIQFSYNFDQGLAPGDSTTFSLKSGCYDFKATLLNANGMFTRMSSPSEIAFSENTQLDNGSAWNLPVQYPLITMKNEVVWDILELQATHCSNSFDSDQPPYDVIGHNIRGYDEYLVSIGEGCAHIRAVMEDGDEFVWEDRVFDGSSHLELSVVYVDEDGNRIGKQMVVREYGQ